MLKPFRYLHDPQACWHNEMPAQCIACRQHRPGFGFITLHENGYDEHHVCEACLFSARLETLGLHVNTADSEMLRQQLRQQHPEMTEEERETIVEARTKEAECCTPRPAIFNEFLWPAHCGDYCVFFHKVNAEDVNRLAADGDGKTFLQTHLEPAFQDVDADFISNIWNDRLEGFINVYLWQCSQCREYRLTFDSD